MVLQYAVYGAFLGVLNNTHFHEHIDLQARCISEASGRFKKACPESSRRVRPARPQPFLRAERTSST